MQFKSLYIVVALGLMITPSLAAPVVPEVNDDRGSLQLGRDEATYINHRDMTPALEFKIKTRSEDLVEKRFVKKYWNKFTRKICGKFCKD